MSKFRKVTIKCDAKKLGELLDLLDVDYVEEIMISRTWEEFREDYKFKTTFGLLEDDDDFEWDN